MHAVALADCEPALPQLPLEPDLFGRVLYDVHEGRGSEYYLRRDDNFLERDSSARYFYSWEKMPSHHRCLLNHARGRVLDVGAGAGQHTLVLQQRGLEAIAVDSSPLAVDVCRQRGVVDARVIDAAALEFPAESFDTILLMNNNMGIGGTPEGLRDLLLSLHRITKPGGQILADFTDYTATMEPNHLRYHRRNIAQGRYPGSIHLRVEYEGKRGPDFDWLLITLGDLRTLCEETGWHIARCVQVNSGPLYAVGIAKD